MQIRVVTLFPELISGALGFGVCGRALARGLAAVGTVNPRDFALDAHRSVDDRPYGGGPGMVMKFEPLRAAIRRARAELPAGSRVLFLSPQGRRFEQSTAREMSRWSGFALVAGRYEGFDERIVEAESDGELSLGDFVLSGGEFAALAVVDAVVRLLPGTLGDEASAEQESFSTGLLDCPQYTRPEQVDGRPVPPVLLGGDHEAIRRWRLQQALLRTYQRRPDLLESRVLAAEERELLRSAGTGQGFPGEQSPDVE